MKKSIMVFILAIAALLVSCGQETADNQQAEEDLEVSIEETETRVVPADEPSIATELWANKIRNRTDWSFMPGTEMLQEGQSPHGAWLTTYVNDVAERAIGEDADAMPDGAIVVKENYDDNQEMTKITAMTKRDGEWYWLVYSPDGTVQNEGDIGSCNECHAKAGKDKLFYWKAE